MSIQEAPRGVARSVVPAAPPALSGGRWHARLSALPRAVPPAEAARRALGEDDQNKPFRKPFGAERLDARLVDVPLTLRPENAPSRTLQRAGEDVVTREGGRQAWTLRDAGHGEYNIVLVDGDRCRVVGAEGTTGRGVALATADDGSGRQRWSFKQVGDSTFLARLASGKRDDKVYLGIDDDNSVRLFSKENRRSVWTLTALRFCDDGHPATDDTPDTTTEPPADEHETAGGHLPASVAEDLRALTGLHAAQVDTILRLVSLPENGHPRWWQNYDYIEFLGDGRGFTATIFGACSGTGDLYMVFEELDRLPAKSEACRRLLEYKAALRGKEGDDIRGIEPIKGIIRTLGADPAWRRAVWKVFLKLYWRFAAEWAAKRGAAAGRPGPRLTLPVSIGLAVDTVINHGADMESVMKIVRKMPAAAHSAGEVAWTRAFADAREKLLRAGYQNLDTSRTGDRCRLWKELLEDNPQLDTPFKAYAGYWGHYTVE